VTGWTAAAVTAIATLATLLAEPRSRDAARGFKMVASTAFIVVAIVAGALDETFGAIVLVGLAFSWIGDLALTYRKSQAFLLGLGAFLLGHIAYTGAFIVRGLSGTAAVVAVVGAVLVAAAVVPWLLPHVDDEMRYPVIAYMAVISLMIVAAAGTHGADADWRIVIGAGLFYLSDIFVARDRFVRPGPVNRWVGLPLYYGGQLLLAWAAGG
jgi:uncharacterized membrane protein YhhN